MNNIEINYERNFMGSYMKIPMGEIKEFDEKILLKRKIPGLLTVEKTFINNNAQYWYNISGKQSLESICSFKSISLSLIEQIILSICSEVEILEKNMIDNRCLVLNPELIYITNQNGEVIFTAYPGENKDISVQFQGLMEFMLTKIDHSDPQAVHFAYMIYEKTLDRSYNLMDIRDIIIQSREKAAMEQYEKAPVVEEMCAREPETAYGVERNSYMQQASASKIFGKNSENTENYNYIDQRTPMNNHKSKERNRKKEKSSRMDFGKRFKLLFDEVRNDFGMKKSSSHEEESYFVSPDEIVTEVEPVYNPTVCLSDYNRKAQGTLLYEGNEGFDNITITNSSIKIGKGKEVDATINKETISRFHALISKESSDFYLEDLNSTNGTFVNDNPLSYRQRTQLKINDTIRFADVKYRFI